MSILRNKLKEKYSSIPNEVIISKEISAGAFRVFCYLFSRPNGWKVFNKDIQNNLGIAKSQTLSKYWKELITSGWLDRKRIRDAKGKIISGYDYILNESPILPIMVDMEKESSIMPILSNAHNSTCAKMGAHSNTNLINKTNNMLDPVFFELDDLEIKRISSKNNIYQTSFWLVATELNDKKIFNDKDDLILAAIQITKRQEGYDEIVTSPFHFAKVYEIVELERTEQLSALQHLYLSAILDEVLRHKDIHKSEAYGWAEFQLSSPKHHFINKDFRHSCNIIKKQLFKEGRQSYAKPIGFKKFSMMRGMK